MARLAGFFNVLEEARRFDMRQTRTTRRTARYANAFEELSDEEFIKKYRITKDIFNDLVEELSPFLKAPSRKSDISIKYKILITLSFYATGSYQRLTGRCISTIMSQQSVSKAIREVTVAFNNAAILKKYIKFPASLQERNVIKRQFYEKYNKPGIIGCINGTHVALVRPTENEEWYFNRKHYHSRNVQIICDYDLDVLSVDACFGGATHDSFIFNNHPIKDHIINLVNQGEFVHLLGDSGYAQREYMMVPIVNAPVGSPEEYYTQQHCSARNRVERTIGVLKTRWRCLLKHRVLHYSPEMVSQIINACCVLHNICNQARIPVPTLVNILATDMPNEEHYDAPNARGDDLRRGQEARQRIINNLWRLSH